MSPDVPGKKEHVVSIGGSSGFPISSDSQDSYHRTGPDAFGTSTVRGSETVRTRPYVCWGGNVPSGTCSPVVSVKFSRRLWYISFPTSFGRRWSGRRESGPGPEDEFRRLPWHDPEDGRTEGPDTGEPGEGGRGRKTTDTRGLGRAGSSRRRRRPRRRGNIIEYVYALEGSVSLQCGRRAPRDSCLL